MASTTTSSIHDQVNYEALNRKLRTMSEFNEKVLANVSRHIEYFEKKYDSLIGVETSAYQKEEILKKVEKDIVLVQKMKDDIKETYYINVLDKENITNDNKSFGGLTLDTPLTDPSKDDIENKQKFLAKMIEEKGTNTKHVLKLGEKNYDAEKMLNNIREYRNYDKQYDNQIRDLKLLIDKFNRDKRIDDTYRTVNEMNGRMINQASEFSSGQQTCSIDKYNKINEKKNNNLVKSLFNSTIGRLYLDWLGFEKGAISSALNGLTRSQEVANANETAQQLLDNVQSKLGGDGGNEDKIQKILEQLGIIYGSFMVLMKRLLQDTGGDLETIAFEKAFDIVGGVAEGSFKGIMHAIGQIPPFGLIFSVLSMIDAAVSGVAKTAATGMMVLDPILDMFNAATGYDTNEFKDLIRNIGDVKNVIMSGSSPNSGLLANSAYVDCKADKTST